MQSSKLQFKIQNLLNKKFLILFFILLLGLFLRVFQLKERFLYGHDQDLAGWIVKDVVVNKHLRLIGQETSTQGVFIGPLFYYLQIPFYLIANMDPIGGNYLVTILGLLTIISFYFVFNKIFNINTGLIASFIYAISFYTVFNDREVVPTMPVILWAVWFLYALHLLLVGKQRFAYLLFGLLIGLIWHLNFALVLVVPLVAVAQFLSKKKLDLNVIVGGTFLLLLASTPLLLFEVRHGFLQTKAIFISLSTPQHDVISGFEKLKRVWFLMSKNVHALIMGTIRGVEFETVSLALVLIFLFLVFKKAINKKLAIIMLLWVLMYVNFFTSYSKVVSEYYLNGALVVWIAIVSVFISYLISRKDYKHFGFIILSFFTIYNLNKYFTSSINKSGYIERKAIVSEIKKDAGKRDYPCVAVSYITDPGYELGYRYFFWLQNMHVNRPDSGSPVYTIVFPLKSIFPTQKNFGAIGLIYPDYERYNDESVKMSCSGENSNLTDSMFGYTE